MKTPKKHCEMILKAIKIDFVEIQVTARKRKKERNREWDTVVGEEKSKIGNEIQQQERNNIKQDREIVHYK